MSRKTKERLARAEAVRISRAEVAGIRAQLDEAYAYFNSISDPDLIEPCVYELSALHARYNSAIRKAKLIL